MKVMDTADKEKREQLAQVLKEKKIFPVYQPIVSLEDGEVLGYEALSRVDMENCLFNTEEMFLLAEEENCVWEIEELCRMKSLHNAVGKKPGIKLFLNVDPGVIKDEKFTEGVTCRYLQQFKLQPEDIVFEITERTSIRDEAMFKETIHHYQNQNFQIAIDDFGNGYAGMNRICSLEPEYIKIDMAIVRNIDSDNFKKSLVESMIQFCENVNIRLIAEGIETRKELKTLIKMGIPYGQGYYLARPGQEMKDISQELKSDIRKIHNKKNQYEYKPSFFGNVGAICKPKETVQAERAAKDIYEYMRDNPRVTEVCVLNEQKQVLGVLTRTEVMAAFGGRYGYDLSVRNKVCEMMDEHALIVDYNVSIEKVSKMALMRSQSKLYDAVIVTRDDKYCGVVTVKDLLEAAITIQVNRAVEANPLTGLPGNMVIEEKISSTVTKSEPFSVIYIDLDNFKAYNDAYGFNNGDLMIKAVADSMEETCSREEFMGHIGGDDFVIIAGHYQVEELFQGITEKFKRYIQGLYSEEDYKNRFIVSKNRHGFEEKFPIATLSMAVVTNRTHKFTNLEDFSKELVQVKKKSKQMEGNSCVIND